MNKRIPMFGSHAQWLGRGIDLLVPPTIPQPASQLRSEMRIRDSVFEEQDDPEIRKEESTLCPFGAPLLGDVCQVGCMACDQGVRCCTVGESCDVTTECLQDPDTKQCPYASYLPACMMCNNKLGEPTLKACKPGDTCTATTFCTAYSPANRVKPVQLSAAARANPANQAYLAQRQIQDVQYRRMQMAAQNRSQY